MSIVSDIFAGGVQGIIDSITNAIRSVKADPTKVIELETAVEQAKVALITLSVQAETAAQQAVNQSIQAEGKSDHWIQWSWRPLFGLTGAAILINNYILYSYFAKWGVVQVIVPSEVWLTIMAVLGVTAYTRGQEKLARLGTQDVTR